MVNKNNKNFFQTSKVKLTLAILLIGFLALAIQFPTLGQFIWPFSFEQDGRSAFSFFSFMSSSKTATSQSSSASTPGPQPDGTYVFPQGSGPASGGPGVSSTVPVGLLADVNSPCVPSFNDACKAAKATAQATSGAACKATCVAAHCTDGALSCTCPPESAVTTYNKDGTCTVSVQAVCTCMCSGCPPGTELPRGRMN